MNDKMEAPPPPTKRQKMDQNEDCKLKEAMSDHVEDLIERNKSSKDIDTDSFVTDDDLQKLREFKVLDEVKCNEEDSNDEDSNSSDDDKSVGLPEEEIEKMLEENLPDGFKTAPKPKEKTYTTRTKIVLEEKVINQFEVLPLDWMVVTHHSGMPIYIHKTTRVCSLSKPYFLGKGNIRRHDIPLSAIPCLAYKRALEEEEKQKEIDRQVNEQIKNLNQTTGEASKTCPVNKNSLLDKFVKNKQSGFNPNISLSTNTQSKCSFNQLDKVNTGDSQNVENNKDMEVDNSAISNKMVIEANKVCEIANEFSTLDFANDSIIHEEVANKKYSTSDGQNDIKTYLSNENNEKLQIVENLETTTNKKLGAETSAVEINEKSDLKEDKSQNSTLFENVETTTNKEVGAETSAVEINEKSDLKEDESQNSTLLNRRSVILPNGEIMPAPRVESVNNNWKTQNLTPEQLNNYCKSLFIFKTINIMQFNRWADRRKYARAKKAMQYPTLPEGTKLITIPVQNSGQDSGGKGAKRDWVMNMNGGSYLSVFHEYVCRALHKQPVYEYRQIENATTPYQASVYIGGMQYGVGLGSSKRQAKYAAARASIQILIPEMREYMDAPVADQHAKPDFSFFDYMAIEDPRIPEFCAASCEPSPHAILRTCLLRNFGTSDRHIHTEMKKIACLEIEMTMTVGKHSATVVCKNKKTAKQRASQAILQALHPHVRSWGSLLRLYGSKSVKSCKEKKLEEQQITLLQDKARRNEPNHAVLEKLRNEMRKLRERDQSVVPIGTLLLTEDLPTHSGSNLNNVDM